MKALVTGERGFIGSRLFETLLNDGHEVWGLNCDVRNFGCVQDKIHSVQPDVVFHLAAFGNSPDETDLKGIYDINVGGTANILSATSAETKIVFASSSSIYGACLEPMKEGDVPVPNSHYAVSKICAEDMIRNSRTPASILRLFSVYGPGEASYRLIPTIRKKRMAREILETTRAYAVRDFVHIDDVVEAFIYFSDKLSGTFNIGTGRSWSVKDVADLAGVELKVTGVNSRPWESPVWEADMYHTAANGWRAKIGFIDGLRRYIETGDEG